MGFFYMHGQAIDGEKIQDVVMRGRPSVVQLAV